MQNIHCTEAHSCTLTFMHNAQPSQGIGVGTGYWSNSPVASHCRSCFTQSVAPTVCASQGLCLTQFVPHTADNAHSRCHTPLHHFHISLGGADQAVGLPLVDCPTQLIFTWIFIQMTLIFCKKNGRKGTFLPEIGAQTFYTHQYAVDVFHYKAKRTQQGNLLDCPAHFLWIHG